MKKLNKYFENKEEMKKSKIIYLNKEEKLNNFQKEIYKEYNLEISKYLNNWLFKNDKLLEGLSNSVYRNKYEDRKVFKDCLSLKSYKLLKNGFKLKLSSYYGEGRYIYRYIMLTWDHLNWIKNISDEDLNNYLISENKLFKLEKERIQKEKETKEELLELKRLETKYKEIK